MLINKRKELIYMFSGILGKIFCFIGWWVFSYNMVKPLIKVCLQGNKKKVHKKVVKVEKEKQWFYDVA